MIIARRTAAAAASVLLALGGVALAAPAEAAPRPPVPQENRPQIPDILGATGEPIGVVDTIYDTVEDPFGQVYNTAVGLIRGMFTQLGGGRGQEMVGNALQPLNLNPLTMQPLQPKPQAPAWQSTPPPPPQRP